jgi:hypothetical protein
MLEEADEVEWATRSDLPGRRFCLFLNDRPLESVPQRVMQLRVRSDKKLHLAKLTNGESELDFIQRFIAALSTEDSSSGIVDAWCEGDYLVVLSPHFDRIRVSFSVLPKVNRQIAEDQHRFELDGYGDYIYWPSCDVHLGWSQLQQLADPMAKLKAEQRSAEFNARYGEAVRRVRVAHNLTQSAIHGLSERSVRRIEQGNTRATADALKKLAHAHGLSAAEYMAEVAKLL